MSRRKDPSRFLVIISIIVMHIATPTAAWFCIWCDPEKSQNFVNCACEGLSKSKTFTNVPISGLDDMRNSMLAASNAINRSSDAMKMKMMNGAMAGELAELIKSQSGYENNDVITRNIMEIIGYCFFRYTGQSHVTFIQELVDTINSILKEPYNEPNENPRKFIPFSAPPQYLMKTSEISSAFSRSNINNQPSIGGPNNLPQQQASSSASAASARSFIPLQGNNQPGFFSPQQGNAIPPSNDFAIPQSFPATPPIISKSSAIANGASAANIPTNGPNLINQQPNSVRNTPRNNYYDYASDYEVQPNANGFSRVNSPYPQYPNDQANFAPNSAFQMTRSNAQASSFNTANTVPLYRQGPDLYLPQDSLSQQMNTNNSAAPNANRIYSLNNQISNEPKKYNQNVVTVNAANSDRNAFNIGQAYNNPQSYDNYKSSAVSSSAVRRFSLGNVNNQPGAYSSESASSGSSASSTDNRDNSYPSNNFNPPDSQRNNNIGQAYDNPQAYDNYKSPAVSSSAVETFSLENGNNNQPAAYSAGSASSGSSASSTDNRVNFYPSNNFNRPYSQRNNNIGQAYDNPRSFDNYKSSTVSSSAVGTFSLENGNNNQPGAYSVGSASSGSSVSSTDNRDNSYTSNNFNPPDSQRNNLPRQSTKDKQSPNEQTKRPKVTDMKPVNNNDSKQQDFSSGENDDAVAIAMRFSETLFVPLSKSEVFTSIFNLHISNDNAASTAYSAMIAALNNCGYSRYSREVADACVDLIKQIPENSSCDKYGEAFSKSLMSQFYNKHLISDNPEDQARCITSSILSNLKRVLSDRSSPNSSDKIRSSGSDVASNKKANSNENSNVPQSNSSSSEKRRSRMARRFYKTLCKRLLASTCFRNIFNRKTSKAKAKRWVKSMLRHSFKSDYGNKLAREAANESARRLSDVPAHCKTSVYVNVIAKCLTDILFYYDEILLDNPVSQAISIASTITKWLIRALNGKVQSTTVSPQSTDYSTLQSTSTPESNDNRQDYYQDTDTVDYTNQQTSDVSSSAVASSEFVSNGQSNADSSNTNNNTNYPYYDDYSNQQSNANSGTDNNYIQYYDDYPYQKQSQNNNDNINDSNMKPIQTQGNAASYRFQKNGKKRENRNPSWNSNAHNTLTFDATPADNTASPNGYQSANLNSNNNNDNSYQSKQTPPNSTKSCSKDRIQILKKVIPSYISNRNFNYKTLGKFLRDLLKNMLLTYKDWRSEKVRGILIVECLIACLQLLTEARSMRCNGNQVERNSPPPNDGNRKLLTSPGIVIPNAQPIKGSQNRQDSVNSFSQRTQNIYPRQELWNPNSALGQERNGSNRSITTQNKNTNINLMPSRNQGNEFY